MKEGAWDSGVKRFGSSSSWPILYVCVLNFPELQGSHLQATVKVRKGSDRDPLQNCWHLTRERSNSRAYLSDGGSWRIPLTLT